MAYPLEYGQVWDMCVRVRGVCVWCVCLVWLCALVRVCLHAHLHMHT